MIELGPGIPIPEGLGATTAACTDCASIDAIVAALYETLSGPAGAPRDWERLRSLYLPGAHLIPGRPDADGAVDFEMFDFEGYVRSREPYFAAHAFYESELARRTEHYGCIAQVFSTYESRVDPAAPPFMRGINAFQLLYARNRWWIVSVIWQHEGAHAPLPAKYTGEKGEASSITRS